MPRYLVETFVRAGHRVMIKGQSEAHAGTVRWNLLQPHRGIGQGKSRSQRAWLSPWCRVKSCLRRTSRIRSRS